MKRLLVWLSLLWARLFGRTPASAAAAPWPTEPGTPADKARALNGKPQIVKIGDEAVAVHAFGWVQLHDVIEAAWPVVDLLVSGNPRTVFHAITANRAAMTRLISLSTGWPDARIDALGMSDGIKLASAVWQENSDFFVRELTPLIVTVIGSKAASSGKAKSESSAAPQPSPAAETMPASTSTNGPASPMNWSVPATPGATSSE